MRNYFLLLVIIYFFLNTSAQDESDRYTLPLEKENYPGITLAQYDNSGKKYIEPGDYRSVYKWIQKDLEIISAYPNIKDRASANYNFANEQLAQENNIIAIRYYNKAIEMYTEIGDKTGLVNCYNNLGVSYANIQKYAMAIDCYNKALDLTVLLNDTSGIYFAYNNIGLIFFYQSSYDNALKNYYKALRYANMFGDKNSIATISFNVATILAEQGNYNEALRYNWEALNHKMIERDTLNMANIYTNIGGILQRQMKYSDASVYLQKSLGLMKKIKNKNGIALCTMEIANLQYTTKKYHASLSSYKYSASLFSEIDNTLGLAEVNLRIANTLCKLKQFQPAEKYYLKAIKIGEPIKAKVVLKEAYIGMCEVLKLKNDYQSALLYYSKYHKLNDSIFNIEKNRQIETINAQYQTEIKDKSIKIGKIELEKQLLQNSNLRSKLKFGIGFGLLLLTLLIGIGVVLAKTKVKNLELERLNKTIQSNNKKITTLSVQIARHQSQMNSHFIFNAINSLQSLVLKDDRVLANKQIHSLAKLMRTTFNNSEKNYISVCKDLEYIKDYAAFELNRFVNKFELIIHVDPAINQFSCEIPTMIIQPFVENAIKHGGLNKKKEGKIVVSIKFLTENPNNLLEITIEDNGKGIGEILTNQQILENSKMKGLNITCRRIEVELQEKNINYPTYLNIQDVKFNLAEKSGTLVRFVVPYYLRTKS